MHQVIPVVFRACGVNKFVQHLPGEMVPHAMTVPSLIVTQKMVLSMDWKSAEFSFPFPFFTEIPYFHVLSSRYSFIGDEPDEETGMWMVEPDICNDGSRLLAVIVRGHNL